MPATTYSNALVGRILDPCHGREELGQSKRAKGPHERCLHFTFFSGLDFDGDTESDHQGDCSPASLRWDSNSVDVRLVNPQSILIIQCHIRNKHILVPKNYTFLGGRTSLADEGPPETTTIRLNWYPNICLAPKDIAEDLLHAEGFTDVRYVPNLSIGAVARGEIDFVAVDNCETPQCSFMRLPGAAQAAPL
jgi:hypothetical protein